MVQPEEFDLNTKKDKGMTPISVNAKGTQCPGPIMALRDAIKRAKIGQLINIEVTDPGFKTDVVSWCSVTQNELQSLTEDEGIYTAQILKKTEMGKADVPIKEDSLTIVIFSEEMDKGMAAFNIALGALALGMKVQIFFTFWGLSLIRKHYSNSKTDNKGNIEKSAINMILPKDDTALPLSHSNLMGIGRNMMEQIMKKKNVPPLDFMIHLAKMDGVKFLACQMSMDIMDIKKEELIDKVEIVGVATMLEYARKSNLNYFI